MKRKLILLLVVLLFAFPVVYAVVAPSPNFDVASLNFGSLIFFGGFAKITGVGTGWKGKVGNYVFAMWKGIQVAKTRVIPENPQSEDQTTNRDLFTEFISIFKALVTPLVHKFWNPFVSQYQTGWANLIGANQLMQSGAVMDYEKLIITKGSLPGEDILTATYDIATGVAVCTWAESLPEGALTTDKVVMAIYDSGENKWKFSDGTATRGDETDTCTLASETALADIYIFLFFFVGDFDEPDITSVSDNVGQEAEAPAP